MKKVIFIALLCVGLGTLVSCGGGGGSSSTPVSDTPVVDTPVSDTPVSGVVVDPYIVGAVFCVDENDNWECDADEPVSTASDANGAFTFAAEPADGSRILMSSAGTHNGVPYAYSALAGVYEGGNIVVTPLTTLYAGGLTSAEIAEMLTFAGLVGVTEENVGINPMDGLLSGSTINTENLAVLRSSIASYMLLRIIEGSDTLSELTPLEAYTSAMDSNGVIHSILSAMATYLNEALSAATLTTIAPYDDMLVGYGMSEVTFDDVVKIAVAIADKLSEIGYTTCNATSGTDAEKVTAALTAVQTYATATTDMNTMIANLGPAFYLNRIKGSMSSAIKTGVGAANSTWGTYLDCASGTFVLGDDGSAECYVE